MKYQIAHATNWNEDFFREFHGLHAQRWGSSPHVLAEEWTEFEKLWKTGGVFSERRNYKAWILKKGSQVMARAMVSVKKSDPRFLALGKYERMDAESGRALLEQILLEIPKDFLANNPGLALRAPVDGHFYHGYRFKISGKLPEFFGEPPVTAEYAEDFRATGFTTAGSWKTIEIQRSQAERQFGRIWQIVEPRWQKSGLQIRTLNLRTWKKDLQHLHGLLGQSFDQMPNFESMDWPAFEILFQDLRYLIDPRLVFFADGKNGVEAFAVAIKDPKPLLLSLEKRAKLWPKLMPLWKVLTLWNLGHHRSRLLVLYIGKRPESQALWTGAALGKAITDEGIRQGYTSALICYLAEGSPVFTSLPAPLTEISKYVLFERTWP